MRFFPKTLVLVLVVVLVVVVVILVLVLIFNGGRLVVVVVGALHCFGCIDLIVSTAYGAVVENPR